MELTDFEVDHEIGHLDLHACEGYYSDDDSNWVEPSTDEVAQTHRQIYRAGMAKGVEQWLRHQSSEPEYPPRFLLGGPA